MVYERTRDVLDRAYAFHKELSEHYARLSDKTDKQRLKLTLDYLSRHEQNMASCLEKYEEKALEKVLNTWFKYTPDLCCEVPLSEVTVDSSMTVDDLIRQAIKFDNLLVNLYKKMAEYSVSVDVKELFSELMKLEQNEEHQMVKNALELQTL